MQGSRLIKPCNHHKILQTLFRQHVGADPYPDDFANVLWGHVLLLRFHVAVLAFLSIALCVQLLPLSSLDKHDEHSQMTAVHHLIAQRPDQLLRKLTFSSNKASGSIVCGCCTGAGGGARMIELPLGAARPKARGVWLGGGGGPGPPPDACMLGDTQVCPNLSC